MEQAIETRALPIDEVRKLITEVVRETLGEAARIDYVEERLAALELRLLMGRGAGHLRP